MSAERFSGMVAAEAASAMVARAKILANMVKEWVRVLQKCSEESDERRLWDDRCQGRTVRECAATA